MSIIVEIPSALRRFTANERRLQLDSAATLQDVLREVFDRYPTLQAQLLSQDGRLFSFVGVFVNGRDIRELNSMNTPLQPGDIISLIPAVAGG